MSEDLKPIPLDELPPLKLTASGADEDIREANLQAVMPSPGFPHAVFLLADAITKRADLVLMDFGPSQANVRYQVDGLWFNMPAMSRTVADYMIASMKQLAELDYRERRARQVGQFKVEYLRKKHTCRLTCQGVATGERVAMEIEREKPPLETLEDIGMRRGMREQLVNIMNAPGGMVLFSALPGDGLSTTWRAAMQSTDRFMRDFFVVEEKTRNESEIINVTPVEWDSSRKSISEVIKALLLRQPNVIAFTEMQDGKAVDEYSKLTNGHDITIYLRIHAKHAVEAVARTLLLKPDVAAFSRALQAVVSQRTIRLLCHTCRQPYQPNPNLLAQLGLPAARVPVLYRHFQPSQEQLVGKSGQPVELEPCENCGGPGYFERTGIFELLMVDDRFRAAMQDQPNVQKLSQAAQQSGHITLRDEGIVVVARGDTSLDELQRVLKK